jgi:predicted small secreted protein
MKTTTRYLLPLLAAAALLPLTACNTVSTQTKQFRYTP